MTVRSAGQARASAGSIGKEFQLRPDEFRAIAEMLQEDTGIHLQDCKVALVHSRLSKRLRALGLESFREYCDLVSGEDGAEERQRMLAALTTNVTSFFREPHHFETLKTTVLPPLLAQAKAGRGVRLWSAACSRGHEPYTMAITVLSLMPEAANHDIRILATDIDPDVLAEGAAGTYDESALANVPSSDRHRFFRKVAGHGSKQFEVTPEMRKLVSFRKLNLNGHWPMKGRFDAIFCRNVVIYFDAETQDSLWERLSNSLAPGGYLFIGHSERLSKSVQTRLVPAGITTFCLRGSGSL